MRSFGIPVLPAFVRWGLVASIGGFIAYYSLFAFPPDPSIVAKPEPFQLIPADKWNHFNAYALLAFATVYATVDRNLPPWKHVTFVVGSIFLYGAGIELIQSMLSNRYFSVMDAYANFLGTLVSIPVVLVCSRFELD
jgi:VanZ family protein